MAKVRIVVSFHHFVSRSEIGIDRSFASEDSQGRNEKAVNGVGCPSLYCRVLVSLRFLAPAFCRLTRRCVVLDQRQSNRREQFERSGYNRVRFPRYFF
jgi:hypothetical protein